MDWTIPKEMDCEDKLVCYVDKQVLHPGGVISLRASATEDLVAGLRIFRMGWYSGAGARLIQSASGLRIPAITTWNKLSKPLPKDELCLEWPEVISISIGDDWCEGLYIARLELVDGKATMAPFWLTSPQEVTGLTVVFSPINIQARNWWGGYSATQVINGRSEKRRDLYHPIGIKEINLNRPMYNSRGGDALRWDYPLIRFLERHDIPITYSSDIDITNSRIIPKSVSHLVTTGPMRYWTKEFESSLSDFIQSGGNYVHLGSEAGQHIVSLDSGIVALHGDEIGERLENPLTNSRPSGSKPKPPWSSMQVKLDGLDSFEVQGLIGSSWDRARDGSKVVALGYGRHKFLRKRIAESSTNSIGLGTVFNSAVSNWTWALSAYRRQGNIKVNENLQKFTLSLLGIDPNLLDTNQDTDMILDDDDSLSNLSLEELEEILKEDSDNFLALLNSGIRLFELDRYDEAGKRLEKAHELRPRSILATYRLARNHHKMKRYEEMIPLYHELLRQRPDRFHYLQQYGALLLSLNRFEEGRRVIEKAISLRPKEPSSYITLANDARKRGKFDYAFDMLNSALRVSSGNKSAKSTLAMMYESQSDFLKAREEWLSLLTIDPKNTRAKMGAARCAYRAKNYDIAFPVFQEIINQGTYRYIREAGMYSIHIAVNHYRDDDKVIEICRILLDKYLQCFSGKNNSHVPVTQMALAFARNGKWESGLRLADHHRTLFKSSSEYYLLKSQLYLVGKDFDSHLNMVKQSFAYHDPLNLNFETNDEMKRCRVNDLHSSYEPKFSGPLVSVIMTVYGFNELVKHAIRSVQEQSYDNLELIIVDDCSSDNDFEQLREVSKEDNRIKIVQMNKNGGTYSAKNYGMSIANGKYIAFHDSDDWLHPRKIETQVSLMLEQPNLVATFSNYFRVDESGNVIFRGIGAVRPACISLVMDREAILTKIGYFDSVRVSADSEYEYRIISVFGEERVEYLPSPLLIASVRSESLSQGGKFAVGWSGLSGHRLDYRREYTKWHDSDDFKLNPYIEIQSQNRRFPAPKEMM